MATTTGREPSQAGSAARTVPAADLQRAEDVGFDWAMIALCGWLVGGAYLDAWAHNHVPFLETFFTPWHAVLYSGFLAVALFVVSVWLAHRRPGRAWRGGVSPRPDPLPVGGGPLCRVRPRGAFLALPPVVEQNMDAALSPPHLLLACSIGLIVSGPLRAAWQRPGAPASWVAHLPLLLSLTYVLSLCTLVTQYADPFVLPLAAQSPFGADPN